MDAEYVADPIGPSPSRVLLCDDSPVERLALAHMLRHSGYQVDETGDGAEALEFLKNREVDVILLDLQMPGVDGFHVLRYLQQHRRGLPVILLSGMPVDEIQEHIHVLPSHELPPLFLKPIDVESLMQLLELQLSGQMPDMSDEKSGNGSFDLP